ncbi:hypothetical protein JXA63_01525 [Candidatus Woesebacteria bacterium]|nr:hypothetical protein [Candidatus Woesebacteria bacterium]
MKVFFTCSTRSIDKNAQYYREIRDQIIAQGHSIDRDWIDYAINVAHRDIPDIPSPARYKDVMSAILIADVVIVDTSIKSMSIGHQITYALQKEKPVLVLRHKNKNKELEKLFIEGSESEKLSVNEYKNLSEIKKILSNFFSKFDDKPVKRFNLALTISEDNYINWASFNYKKSKTEVIQESIDKIAEKDISYKKYLSRQT